MAILHVDAITRLRSDVLVRESVRQELLNGDGFGQRVAVVELHRRDASTEKLLAYDRKVLDAISLSDEQLVQRARRAFERFCQK